ncbi:MAG: Na+/H+ antiporter subunit G [Paracoccaceae bacterium]
MILADILITALLVVGGLFGLLGSYGLLRLRDTMQRLHAPTKATTVGLGATLIASMLNAAVMGRFSWQELIVTLFLLLTAPITANFIAKAQIHLARPDLPPSGQRPWATLDREG